MSADGEEPTESSAWSEGLRERKKRLTRSLISDTATAMFLERGFDDVKVAEIAEAAGVSEKTVYNYFPTKESLLFDREPEVAAEIWQALGAGSPDRSPVEGVVALLEADREELLSNWDRDGREMLRRFSALIDANPSLQAALREMSDRLERTAAEALAERAGVRPDEPEPRVAAAALITLWRIEYDLRRRCAAEGRSAEETKGLLGTEIQRAARVAESGLWWFGAMADGRPTRQQLKVAADAALTAGRQVISAVRQARAAWEQLQRDRDRGDHRGDRDPYGLAQIIEETERLKQDIRDRPDEWKRAYREHQVRIRQAQRELAQRYRQAARQHYQNRGRQGPGPEGFGEH